MSHLRNLSKVKASYWFYRFFLLFFISLISSLIFILSCLSLIHISEPTRH